MSQEDSNDPAMRQWFSYIFYSVITICAVVVLYLASYGPLIRFTSTKTHSGPAGVTVMMWPQWVHVMYSPVESWTFSQPRIPEGPRYWYRCYVGWWINLGR